MIKVTIHEAKGFTNSELSKLEQAVEFLERTLESGWFRAKVLGHTWGKQLRFADTNLSNLEVYNKIMSGGEALSPDEDYELDIYITIYNTWLRGRNVIGYTYPNSPMQYINRRFYRIYNNRQIASNILHEYCHKLGFTHDYSATSKRPYSVPYAIGYMLLGAPHIMLKSTPQNVFNNHI